MAVIIRRLEFFIFTLWAALTLNFILPRLMPGDPAATMMARYKGRLNPASLHALQAAFGLRTNQNIFQQYVSYLNNMVHLQFGTSISYFPDSVSHVVLQALPWTLALAGLTTVISFVLGTFIGMVVAWRRGKTVDGVVTPLFVILSAVPYFWLGLISIYIFSVSHAILPLGFGYDEGSTIQLSPGFLHQVLLHAILPAGTIIVTSIGGWILTMRNNMLGTISEDYVRMARAKGLSPLRTMVLYAGRNAILPNLTGFALALGFVVSGLLLTEIVFSYPGVGYLFLQAVDNEDFPLMQALFLFVTVAVLVAVLLADVANALLDPRTRSRS
ncbi:MAG TPA: ABC transporter permease [Chloroflexota bacterium]